MRNYPIGIQTFSEIIERQFAYVDKTAFVYKMAHESKAYFLARPRRFGKSLMISTLDSYFSGQKELFKGLAIEKLEKDWIKYPVFRFDMSGTKYDEIAALKERLSFMLSGYEEIYGSSAQNFDKFGVRLSALIKNAYQQTGKKVVVLIDEYDAPLLDTMVDDDTFKKMRTMLRDFYSPLKESDQYLRFVFLTGITKFSQLSIFSELNNLNNISMQDAFAGICGITKEELLTDFKENIQNLADKNGFSYDQAVDKLKATYDGYHFSKNSPDVFNPFSLIKCLNDGEFNHYWFGTGTPTYLTEIVSKYTIEPKEYEEGVWLTSTMFDAPTETATDPLPLLYQSGYLTIKEYDPDGGLYKLAYPNEEVRIGFNRGLLPHYANVTQSVADTLIVNLILAFKKDDVERVITLLRSFLSSIPYNSERQDEQHFKTICYLVCRLCTPYGVRTEECTAAGRADVIVETKTALFCFEFKADGSAQQALEQIDQKGYLIPYEAGGKKLVKIGVNFDRQKRTIGEWVVACQN